jgi:hypothetical protein
VFDAELDPELTDEERAVAVTEEGWILGAPLR